MQSPQTFHTYQNKYTTSAKTPRGFDLSKGPNQKTFGTNAQQVQKTPRGFDPSKGPNQNTFGTNAKQVQKRHWASTFQKIRTKTPSAQAHNKCKNATGLRPFKASEPKRAHKVQS